MDYRLHEMMQKMCGNHVSDYLSMVKPLIDTMTIQRLSKERGEVIVKVLGQYPFITELPDIDEYDFNIPEGKDAIFTNRVLKKRETFNLHENLIEKIKGNKNDSKSQLPNITERMKRKSELYENITKPPPLIADKMDASDMDSLIARIDKKVSEMEELERIQNEEKYERVLENAGSKDIQFPDFPIEAAEIIKKGIIAGLDRKIAELEELESIKKSSELELNEETENNILEIIGSTVDLSFWSEFEDYDNDGNMINEELDIPELEINDSNFPESTE